MHIEWVHESYSRYINHAEFLGPNAMDVVLVFRYKQAVYM
jgi:hypothetical protein